MNKKKYTHQVQDFLNSVLKFYIVCGSQLLLQCPPNHLGCFCSYFYFVFSLSHWNSLPWDYYQQHIANTSKCLPFKKKKKKSVFAKSMKLTQLLWRYVRSRADKPLKIPFVSKNDDFHLVISYSFIICSHTATIQKSDNTDLPCSSAWIGNSARNIKF